MLASKWSLLALGSVILIPQSVKVPALEGASTVTVTFCEAKGAKLPEGVETWHQVPALPGTPVALQLRVSPPLFVIVMVCPPGVAPPEAEGPKVKDEGFIKIVGGF